MSVDKDNVLIEAIKPAEKIDNAFVVRLYECENNKTQCVLTLPKDVKKVCVSNMLEDVKGELEIKNGKVELQFRAFEIKTLVLYR